MLRKSIRPYIAALAILFVTSALTGYLVPPRYQHDMGRDITAFFAPFKTLTPGKIFLFIFLNNFFKSLLSLLLGFLFGVVPLLFIIGNGYILGMIVSLSMPHMSLGEIALRIVPHGILEIPAFVIAASHGVMLGVTFYRTLVHKEVFREVFFKSLKYFMKMIAPLLLAAAAIESFITPLLIAIVS